jgi:hypothetical protein
MFGDTWRWAGTFRDSGKNSGLDPADIQPALRNLCEDVKTQHKHESYPLDEIAARFSHRLVWIHPFANGNGRLSRTMADVLLVQYGASRFSWRWKPGSRRRGAPTVPRCIARRRCQRLPPVIGFRTVVISFYLLQRPSRFQLRGRSRLLRAGRMAGRRVSLIGSRGFCKLVIPAKAGIQRLCDERHWVLAFAGTTTGWAGSIRAGAGSAI